MIIEVDTWTDIKTFADTRGVRIQHIEFPDRFVLVAKDQTIGVSFILYKNTSDTNHLSDFENNYESNGHKNFKVDYGERFFAQVNGTVTTQSTGVVIPNNVTVAITRINFHAISPGETVALIWARGTGSQDILFSTTRSADLKLPPELPYYRVTGNNTHKLEIQLSNTTQARSATMGGHWEASIV